MGGSLEERLSIDSVGGEVLKDIVTRIKPKVCVEIGTGFGRSTCWILEGLGKNGKVITFDEVERNPKLYEDDKRVEFINDKFDWGKGKVDFVFHDAGHWFEHVTGDLGKILKNVRKGGVVCVHDIIHSYEMGEKLKEWFDKKPEWKYSEDRRSYGMGVAERI